MPTRRQLARLGAPVAFLLGVTIAVMLIRSGLQGSGTTTPTAGTISVRVSPALAPKKTKTDKRAGGKTSTATTRFYYTIKRGDTLGAVAVKEHTSVAALETLNPGIDPNALRVGQKIRTK